MTPDLFPDLLTVEFALASGIAVLGGLIYGFGGFGGGLIMVPLLALLYGLPAAVAIVGMSVAIGAIQLAPNGLRNADWRSVGLTVAAAFIGAPAGTYLLLSSDPEVARRIIGGLVVAFALIMMTGWTYNGPRNRLTHALVGGVSGVISGFGSGGGAVVSLYFVSWLDDAVRTRANIFTASYVLATLMAGGLIVAGAVSISTVFLMLFLLIPYSAGVRIGAVLFRRASDAQYRRFVLWLLVGIGASTLIF